MLHQNKGIHTENVTFRKSKHFQELQDVFHRYAADFECNKGQNREGGRRCGGGALKSIPNDKEITTTVECFKKVDISNMQSAHLQINLWYGQKKLTQLNLSSLK